MAAAAIADGAASAAIITLAFTVGTWTLDFVAAGRGGFVQQLASYTPTAALRSFEQGLLRFSVVAVIVIVSCAAFFLAAIWLNIGRTIKFRLLVTLALVIVTAVAVVSGANLRASRDLSENRRNSFSSVDEAALRGIKQPLKITIFLSPEDPRLTDFEQNVLKKLRRAQDFLIAKSITERSFTNSEGRRLSSARRSRKLCWIRSIRCQVLPFPIDRLTKAFPVIHWRRSRNTPPQFFIFSGHYL